MLFSTERALLIMLAPWVSGALTVFVCEMYVDIGDCIIIALGASDSARVPLGLGISLHW